MEDVVKDWYRSKDNHLKLQTFINTIKCESFEPPAIKIDENEFLNRIESYNDQSLPAEVKFITAGVDIQDNRTEINFIGWGRGL